MLCSSTFNVSKEEGAGGETDSKAAPIQGTEPSKPTSSAKSLTFVVTKGLKSSATKLTTEKVSSLAGKCHGASSLDADLVKSYGYGTGSFVEMLVTAWSEHLPIELAPDHLWILVLQAFSAYVNANSDKMRSKFVDFSGKQKLWVQDDSLVMFKIENDWSKGIDGWVKQIDEKVKPDAVERLHAQFSSTTRETHLTAKVMIMDVLKSYFDYGMMTRCGFPSITLEGTQEDWQLLVKKTDKLLELAPEFKEKWGPAIIPLLRKFVEPFSGTIDDVFWNSMIKRGATHGSGARQWYTGWLNILFPYLRDGENRYAFTAYAPDLPYAKIGLTHDEEGSFHGRTNGPGRRVFPTCIAQVPVDWDYLGTHHDVFLQSGFMGVTQNPTTLALKPFTGWRIVPKGQEMKGMDDPRARWR